jgi:hypothetical protein
VIEKIHAAIEDANSNGIYDGSFGDVLSGFSGEKLIGALQRLVSTCVSSETCYLEVGVFQGLTLLSTAWANKELSCFGVDNFAFFDTEDKNLNIVKDRQKRLSLENVFVINMDYEEAFLDLKKHTGGKKIAVYFVDGPHDYRSQLMCLQLALPYLADGAVILVDDSNYRHVRQANADFLQTHPQFKLLFDSYTPCHPTNMTPAQEREARAGWWDGVNILVHDPEDRLERRFPPTERSRDLFLQEHELHSERNAALALDALNVANALRKPWKVPRALARLALAVRSHEGRGERYAHLNTYSEALPSGLVPLRARTASQE